MVWFKEDQARGFCSVYGKSFPSLVSITYGVIPGPNFIALLKGTRCLGSVELVFEKRL